MKRWAATVATPYRAVPFAAPPMPSVSALSNAQGEQCNCTDSDHQHGKSDGIVFEPVPT